MFNLCQDILEKIRWMVRRNKKMGIVNINSLEKNRITSILSNYILHDKLHQAIILDAPWGTGKTWYLKNDFIPSFLKADEEKKWHFIYISLFGLNNLSELSKKINQQLMNATLNVYSDKILNTKIPVKLYNATGFALSAFLKYFGNLDTLDYGKLVSILPNVEHIVYVLDDMERTGIDTVELLGLVNNLCEHDNSRVVLVANEAQILSRYNTQQKEESSVNRKDDYKKQENFGDKYPRSPYDQAKEKAVSLTINFRMNPYEAFHIILNSIVEDQKIKDLILEQKDFIMDLFIQNADKENPSLNDVNYMNLRILSFTDAIIYDLLREVFKCLGELRQQNQFDVNEEEFNQIQHDLLQALLRYTAIECLRFKRGRKWRNDNFSYFTKEKQLIYIRYQYTFAREFITHRNIDRQKMKKELNSVIKEYILSYKRKDSPLERLYKWEYMDDEEVNQLLGKLRIGNFPLILEPGYIRSAVILLLQLKSAGFDIDIDSYISIIINAMKNEDILHFPFSKESMYIASYDTLDKELIDAYSEKMTPIYCWLDQELSIRMKKEYSLLINNEWDERFPSWCASHKASFMSNKRFLVYMDVPSALQKLKQSRPSEIYSLLIGISKIYDFMNINDFFKTDLSAIEDFLVGIHKVMESLERVPDNRVKKSNLSKLCNYLENVKKHLR